MQLYCNFTPFPVLTTERLRLRRMQPSDAAALFILRSDERAMQYVDRPRAKSMDDVYPFMEMIEKGLQENSAILWVITMKGSDELIGTIGFWRMQPENFRSEIGYGLLPDYHRKGLMVEALRAVVQYGFEVINLHSIEANINPGNHGSRQVLLRCGFVKEAYFRENYYWQGKFLDSEIYGLLNGVSGSNC